MSMTQMNKWYPYSNPSPQKTRGSSANDSTKTLTGIGAAILLVAVACFAMLVVVFLSIDKLATSTTTTSKCLCDGSSQQSLFFPYGVENGDWKVTDATVPETYYVNDGIGYTLFGKNGALKPIGIKLVASRGLINVGPLENNKVSTTNYGRMGGAIIDTIDSPNEGIHQFILHRKANRTDVAMFQCILPDGVIEQAYLFTWINVTVNGKALGSFQIALVFMVDSTTYIIRNYDNNIQDIAGTTDMFKIVDIETGNKYYSTLTAADVAGKRQMFAGSEPTFGTNLVSVTENQYGVCPS